MSILIGFGSFVDVLVVSHLLTFDLCSLFIRLTAFIVGRVGFHAVCAY